MEIENFDTAIPAKITSVNNDGTVNCQPSIVKIAKNGVFDVYNKPIRNIPLMKLGAASAEISFPSKKGDDVILLAFSRDSNEWKKGKHDVVPESCSGLTLSDFVAIPIVRKKNDSAAKIRITEDGDIEFKPAEGRRIVCASDLVCTGTIYATEEVTAKVQYINGDIVDVPPSIHLTTHSHATGTGQSTPPIVGS